MTTIAPRGISSLPRPRHLFAIAATATCLLLVPGDGEAGTIRGHKIGHRGLGHHGHHVGISYGYGHGYHYRPYSYGHYGHYGYYPYYAYPVYHVGYGRSYAYNGFVDTDVSPEEAEVYVDGEFIGIADDFDGFPRYLALEPGEHTLSFKAEGRRTVTRDVTARRGVIIDLDFTLPRGHDPEPIVDVGQVVENDPAAEEPSGELVLEETRGAETVAAGFVRLNIRPGDASVYLDGEFLGSAATLSRLHGNLRLASGTHRIEIVRPGYRPVTRDVRLLPGDTLTMDFALERVD